MPDYKALVDEIGRQMHATFKPAAAANIIKLAKLGLPEGLLDFYRRFEPVVIENRVGLHNIKGIIRENTQLMPGCFVQPLGYVAFTSTICGDAYCFDLTPGASLTDPAVVLISHEVISKGMTLDQVKPLAKQVARSFSEFLAQLARDEVDEECIY